MIYIAKVADGLRRDALEKKYTEKKGEGPREWAANEPSGDMYAFAPGTGGRSRGGGGNGRRGPVKKGRGQICWAHRAHGSWISCV